MNKPAAELKKLGLLAGVFAAMFFLPVANDRFIASVTEALKLAKWYAREHVLLCLVPAFFIAGAIGVFISQTSVMRYLGPAAKRSVAYAVASVSGSILAVCSCTVLPLFAGIYRMGAGLGPAVAFLYSGPAINVLAIIMTARVLGLKLGIARAVGAISFSVLIGMAMQFIYRKESSEKAATIAQMPQGDSDPLYKQVIFFALMIGILVFANWARPATDTGLWAAIYSSKWVVTSVLAAILAIVLIKWMQVAAWKLIATAAAVTVAALVIPADSLWVALPFTLAVAGLAASLATTKGRGEQWLDSSWEFAKQIVPLLFGGVLVAGLLLGSPGGEGLIKPQYVQMLVGESPQTFLDSCGLTGGGLESAIRVSWPLLTNLFAAVIGAFMYFATLTEIPILQGLLDSGMAGGPALALLLAGPALSLPNMLVIAGVLGPRKTVTFVTLVISAATIAGLIYGTIF